MTPATFPAKRPLRLGSVIFVFGAYTPLRDFFFALGLAAFIVEAWAFIDAIRRPAQAGADAEADLPAELPVGAPGAEAEVLEAALAAEAEAEAEARAEAEAEAGGDPQTVSKNRPDSASD